MGKCRFNDAMKNDFPWALSVHGNPHAVRCRCCNQELNISKGTAVLSRHQETGRHVSASAAAQSQPTIRQQVAQQNDKETIKRKALILHVLKIAVDGSSFRSSDAFSRNRNLYSVMFPDSAYTNIACGYTKCGYILSHVFIVHLDTCVQHIKPVYLLCKTTQGKDCFQGRETIH